MYNLQKKIKEQKQSSSNRQTTTENKTGRISVRDQLLTQEIQDVSKNLPEGCVLVFPDPNMFHQIVLRVTPQTNYWKDGTFIFHVTVPLEYNIMPPLVKCCTRIWHPNIDEDGSVCLSILRSTSIDGSGWAPTRTIKDVIWGISALFTDLLNFDDPLNVEAADQFNNDKKGFIRKVNQYIVVHCQSNSTR